LTQAVGDPLLGMWTQHTVSPSVGPAVRSQVNWYEVQVAAGVPALTQEGAIASSTDFVFNGAISPTFDSHGVAIQYNRSSSSLLPLIAAQSRTTLTPLARWTLSRCSLPRAPTSTRTSPAASWASPAAGATTQGRLPTRSPQAWSGAPTRPLPSTTAPT